jgi:hypothetical protein
MSIYEHRRKTLAGVCMIVAPLFALLSWIIRPEPHTNELAQLLSISAHPDRFLIATILAAAAIACAIPAAAGIMHMLRERQPFFAALGGVLALFGLSLWLLTLGVDMVLWQMTKDGVQVSDVVAYDGLRSSTAGLVLIVWGPMLAAAGFTFLGFGLLIARIVDWWMAAMVVAGPIVIAIAALTGNVAVGIIGSALALIGLGTTGLAVLTETDEQWEHQPAWSGFRTVGAP